MITSSLAALYANENTAHYSAAKAGLVSLAQVMAKELASESIRVNTIHPTTVATGMILNDATYQLFRPDLEHPTREDFEEAARTLNKLPVAALDAQDITEAVLYLVTDAGRYVTGTTHVNRSLTGEDESTVRQMAATGDLYALPDRANEACPAWQFVQTAHGSARPLPHLGEVLARLPRPTHPATMERFFTTPRPHYLLDGREVSAAAWLAGCGDVDVVLADTESLHVLG